MPSEIQNVARTEREIVPHKIAVGNVQSTQLTRFKADSISKKSNSLPSFLIGHFAANTTPMLPRSSTDIARARSVSPSPEKFAREKPAYDPKSINEAQSTGELNARRVNDFMKERAKRNVSMCLRPS
jgi:hypothetical protein